MEVAYTMLLKWIQGKHFVTWSGIFIKVNEWEPCSECTSYSLTMKIKVKDINNLVDVRRQNFDTQMCAKNYASK